MKGELAKQGFCKNTILSWLTKNINIFLNWICILYYAFCLKMLNSIFFNFLYYLDLDLKIRLSRVIFLPQAT